MRFVSSIFGKLVEPINRRAFQSAVESHGGDAYDKSFRSWEHLMALLYAQLSGAGSLRALEVGWNAHSQHHYHLGCGPLRRSTLSDAGRRRPVAVFADTFNLLAGHLDRQARREGQAVVRLIDATPIPLGRLCQWAKSNGRTRGLKMHVVFDPQAASARILDITDANVNDVQVGRGAAIEPGTTYVFDKAYCHYGWWTAIAQAGAFFVTRPKTNMALRVRRRRPIKAARGDGFVVLEDAEVRLASKGDSKLPVSLRRLLVKRQDGGKIVLLTNDLQRSAIAVADLYKSRWQIELLFRWIKQHLNIRKFLANNPNAIRLQLFAAMIAYALLRIAARVHRTAWSILRFTDLLTLCLFDRRNIAQIANLKPPNTNLPKTQPSSLQMAFTYV